MAPKSSAPAPGQPNASAAALLDAAFRGDPESLSGALGSGANPDIALPLPPNNGKPWGVPFWMEAWMAVWNCSKRAPSALGVACYIACSRQHSFAAARGALECARLLLAAGASPDAQPPAGRPPLLCLLDDSRSRTPLKFPHRHRLALISMLSLKGADMDALHPNGRPLALHCIESGDVELCQAMLDHGADIMAPNREGRSMLHEWARNGCYCSLADALAMGALRGIDSLDPEGLTPLDQALRIPVDDRMKCAKVLIRGGCKITPKNWERIVDYGWTDELAALFAHAQAERLRQSLPPDPRSLDNLPRPPRL